MPGTTSTNPNPPTMRSLFQPDIQSTKLILRERPVPAPNFDADEHLIRVHAASICSGELLWAKLFPHPSLKVKEHVPCTDFAGTVEQAPPSSPFRPGDAVYGRTDYGRAGNGRDFTIAVTSELAHVPSRLSWAEAVSAPVSAETAWQALFVQADLPPPTLAADNTVTRSLNGTSVLVTAASGSVGAWVVQLAHAAGAHVVGTCGPDNIDYVRSLGAAEVLDYRATDVPAWAAADGSRNRVDVVIDCSVGAKSLSEMWWCVKDGGVLLSIHQPPEGVRPKDESIAKNVRHGFFIMETNGSQLGRVSPFLNSGACRPIVDSIWPLERYEEAFEKVGSGHCRGKVVFDMDVRS
ncbi:MAG: putative secondary metabolism biosynthetic enzyme [Piccolia ochrophora]|nr:MAG: putative secondary metabolism biosynthetic enzyme [Piccolia ochrophora]